MAQKRKSPDQNHHRAI